MSNFGHAGAPPADPLPDAAALAAMAGFRPAMLAVARTMIDLFDRHRLLNRVLNDRGRFAVGLAILDMHFGADGRLFTSARLQDFCIRNGVCSRGRARALLALLRTKRLLVAVPGGDRRQTVLAASPALLALHRERFGRMFTAMAPLSPLAGAAAAALSEDRFLAALARRVVQRFDEGFRILDVSPALRPVADMAGGLMTLLSLLDGSEGRAGACRIVVTDLSGRYMVSRGHVLQILRTAEAEGLLAIPGRTGAVIEIRPAFVDALERFFAGMFAILLEGMAAGVASCGQEAPPAGVIGTA